MVYSHKSLVNTTTPNLIETWWHVDILNMLTLEKVLYQISFKEM